MAKKAILRYLLQVKFTTNKGKEITNAMNIKALRFILSIYEEELWTPKFNQMYDKILEDIPAINTVVTWSCNGSKTIFNVMYNQQNIDNDFIYGDYLDYITMEESDDHGRTHLIIELEGLHYNLTI